MARIILPSQRLTRCRNNSGQQLRAFSADDGAVLSEFGGLASEMLKLRRRALAAEAR